MKMFASIPFLKNRPIVSRQVISASWDERDKILQQDVNLFCWERNLDPKLEKFLIQVLNESPDPIQIDVDQINLNRQITQAKSQWDFESLANNDLFWKDISMIVNDFLSFSEIRSGTMHLRIVDNDACTRFHTDGYPLRLFTTYYGKGTEWLPEDAVDRNELRKRKGKIVKDKSRVQTLGTGHIGILKGELPDRNKIAKGIVHRSPEISHSGEKRIILRVDIG